MEYTIAHVKLIIVFHNSTFYICNSTLYHVVYNIMASMTMSSKLLSTISYTKPTYNM